MKIKPCPFCGGTKIEPIYDGAFVELRCLQCGASGTSGTIHKDITDHWNTRADKELARLRAENERMREALKRIASIYDSMKPVCECAGDAYDMHCVAAQTLGPSSEQNPETCVWVWSAMGCWYTACRTDIVLSTLDPAPAMCPYCGKKVEVKE